MKKYLFVLLFLNSHLCFSTGAPREEPNEVGGGKAVDIPPKAVDTTPKAVETPPKAVETPPKVSRERKKSHVKLTLAPPGNPSSEGESAIYYRNNDSESPKVLYRVPEFVPVKAEDVSINLMWVSPEKDETKKYIGGFITRERKNFEEVIPDQVIKWMILNPKSDVVLWFDSEMCTKEQSKNTHELVLNLAKEINVTHPELSLNPLSFKMKDVRSLQIVANFKEAFSSAIPIYTRVNALRLIAAVETNELHVSQGKNSAFVYADYTVNPHSFDEVYPGMPKDGFLGIKSSFHLSSAFENTFMIVGNQNQYTLGTFRDLVVSSSKRIHDEREGHVKKEIIGPNSYRGREHFFNSRNGWRDSYLYGLSKTALFIAHIRETLRQDAVQFDPGSGPKIPGTWEELWRFRNCRSFYRDEMTIDYSDKYFDTVLNEVEKGFIAVIDDPRVTITRHSGHGWTGVRIGKPETLEEIIERMKSSTD